MMITLASLQQAYIRPFADSLTTRNFTYLACSVQVAMAAPTMHWQYAAQINSASTTEEEGLT